MLLPRTGPTRAACGNVEIAGITADSRQVRPGWLFAAIAGSKADGARFVPDAIAKGAAAILVEQDARSSRAGDAVLRAAEPRRGAGPDGGALLRRSTETIVAVTGTSGKTSVADFDAADLRRPRPQQRLARHHRPRQARRRASTAR